MELKTCSHEVKILNGIALSQLLSPTNFFRLQPPERM